MTEELIPAEAIEIITQGDKPRELTLEELPELLPQQRIMLNHILEGCTYLDAYKRAGYKSEQFASRAAYILITRDPLKAHLEYFFKKLANLITPEYIVMKLNKICDDAMHGGENGYINPETAIKAIQEINKMRGNYAQQTLNVHNVNASFEDIRRARLDYKKDR